MGLRLAMTRDLFWVQKSEGSSWLLVSELAYISEKNKFSGTVIGKRIIQYRRVSREIYRIAILKHIFPWSLKCQFSYVFLLILPGKTRGFSG